jgi:hypothetical protein
MKKILLSALATTLLIGTPAFADEIVDQLNATIKAYEGKDYKGAMNELKFITAQLQELDAAENQKLLPAPLEGWSLEKSNDNAGQAMMGMLGGGTTMNATYVKNDEKVEIQILANSPMLAMMSVTITNPALMASNPNTKPYRYKNNNGMIETKERGVEISILVGGQILLKLTGQNLTDQSVIEKYLDAIDLKELKNSLL